MNKYRAFLRSLDFGFEILLILILIFIWSRYFIDDLLLSIVITVTVTTLISFGIAQKKHKKDKNTTILTTNSKKLEDEAFFLTEDSNDVQIQKNKIKEVIDKIKSKVGGQVAPNDNNLLVLKNTLYIVIRKFNPLTKDDIIPYLQNLDTSKISTITVITPNIEPDCLNYLKNISNIHFEIELIDKIATTYFENEFNDNELNLKTKIQFKQNAIITFKLFILMLLKPQNIKGYFFSALILLFASLIVPQKIYYYIFASILIILALISKLINNKQK